MVRLAKRPVGPMAQWRQADHGLNRGDFQRFMLTQRWQQTRQAAGEQGLAGAGRPAEQQVMRACRSDQQRAFGGELALDFAEVRVGLVQVQQTVRLEGSIGTCPFRCATTCSRWSTAITFNPDARQASSAFARGTITLRPALRAASAAGNTPFTARTSPDSANSPRHSTSSSISAGTCTLAARIPRAIARSKRPPSLGRSAGARLRVMRRAGYCSAELRMALRTRSLLSLTAVSGKPTSVSDGRPLAICTSTLTAGASTPIWARLWTMARDMLIP